VLPDERTFREHVARGRFQAGTDRGDWSIVRDGWPHPLISISADNRDGGPEAFVFRFDLNQYPSAGPTSEPWDVDGDCALADELWPAGSGRVIIVFNPSWMPATNVHALYHPMDRLALVGHDTWRVQDPGGVWDPSRMDIVDYLQVIHELLHSTEYSGLRRAA
jgi:hypothetical protein